MLYHAQSHITIAAAPGQVMDVIADFPAYPEWAGGIIRAEVVDPGHGRAEQVRLHIDAGTVTDVQVLSYRWDGDYAVTWLLDSSRMLRSLHGSYVLTPASGGGTEVTYILRLALKVPLLGALHRRAEQVIIDRALTGLQRRVNHLLRSTR